MVGRMGMKGGKKKGEKAPCCHSFRFSVPHSTKGETPATRYSGKLRSKVHFFAKLSNPQKSRNRKFQTPQNWSPSIRARHLKSEVLYYLLQDLWASETEKPSLIRGTQRQFSENICSEDDLRSRIFGTFFVKFLACLPLLGFSNI